MFNQGSLNLAQLAQFGVERAQRGRGLFAENGLARIVRGNLQAERLLALDAIKVGGGLKGGDGLEAVAQGLAQLADEVAALVEPRIARAGRARRRGGDPRERRRRRPRVEAPGRRRGDWGTCAR